MSTLERAVCIAAQAHQGATDKAGAPYLLHPLRVMLRMQTAQERIVAVLHDVVEDTAWTLETLADEGFAPEVLQALDAVTKRPEDKSPAGASHEEKLARYLAFVDRAAANPIGLRVKLADLEDNMDLSRIASPTVEDLARTEKYAQAVRLLRARMQAREGASGA